MAPGDPAAVPHSGPLRRQLSMSSIGESDPGAPYEITSDIDDANQRLLNSSTDMEGLDG